MLNASHWACTDLTSRIFSDQVNKLCFQSGISYCELYAAIRCQRIRIRAPDIARLYTSVDVKQEIAGISNNITALFL